MPISLGEIAARFACDLDGDSDIEITHVASLSSAGPGAISFLSNSRFTDQLSTTKAAAVILRETDKHACPAATLVVDDPYLAYARIATVVHPQRQVVPGIHATAVVDSSAEIAASAQVDAKVVIGERVTVGENVYIGPGCVIGPDCHIADECQLIASVTLPKMVTLGKRCILHPGVVIGADGFGNAMTPAGWVKVPQVGGVRIGDDVEVGANTTIDCGALDDTVIENGVRIDNLCMIAHNVRIGEHTALASMTGIAGSTVIGKRCMFAGQAGVVGHVVICDDVVVSGRGMVSKDITEPGTYASSFPAEKVRDWNHKVARFRRIDALYDRLKKLEKGDQ